MSAEWSLVACKALFAIHPAALQLSRCSLRPTPSLTVEEACETSQASRLRSYIKDVTAIMNEWLVPEKTHAVPSFLVGEVHNDHTRQSNWTLGVKHGSDSKVWPLKRTYYIHTSSISLFSNRVSLQDLQFKITLIFLMLSFSAARSLTHSPKKKINKSSSTSCSFSSFPPW